MKDKWIAAALCVVLTAASLPCAYSDEADQSIPAAEEIPTPEPEPISTPEPEPIVTPEADPTQETSPTSTPDAPTQAPEAARGDLSAVFASCSRYAWAGTLPVQFSAAVSGGAAPYSVAVSIAANGGIVYQKTETLATAGRVSASYMPKSVVSHGITVIVTDAEGSVCSLTASVPVSVYSKEERADWESDFDDLALTGDWREDLVAIAQTQVGYAEDPGSFVVDSAGKKHNYTRYTDWYGNGYMDWCAVFVSFCLHYAQIPAWPVTQTSLTNAMADSAKASGLWEDAEYMPQKGDIIFFDYDNDGFTNHVGIVEVVSGTLVATIEGNVGGKVVRKRYFVTDDGIVGYLNMQKAMDMLGVGADVETEEYGTTVFAVTTGENVNVRSGNSIYSVPLGCVREKGTRVRVYSKVTLTSGEFWYHIGWEDMDGYMRGDYLELETP